MKKKVHIRNYMIYMSFRQDKIIKVNYCIEQGEYHTIKKTKKVNQYLIWKSMDVLQCLKGHYFSSQFSRQI